MDLTKPTTYVLAGPDYLHPLWLRNFSHGNLDAIVGDNGKIIVQGETLRFANQTIALAPGTKLKVWLERQFMCAETEAVARYEEALKQHQVIVAATRAEKLRLDREADAKFNRQYRLPIAWKPGIKDVLSGLSEKSNGDGRNVATVQHILLSEDLHAGRLHRNAGDFLCSSNTAKNGKRWSTQVSELGKITCKQCLLLAERWKT